MPTMMNDYFEGRLTKAETKINKESDNLDVKEFIVLQHSELGDYPEFLTSYIDKFEITNIDQIFRTPIRWSGTVNFEMNKLIKIKFESIELHAELIKIQVTIKLHDDGSQELIYKLHFKYDFLNDVTPILNSYLNQKHEDLNSGKMVKSDFSIFLERSTI